METKFLTRTFDAEYKTRDEDGKKLIEGYFAVFNSPYTGEWGFETIDPAAFDEIGGDDIRALINHDSTYVMGRTTAGTLLLRVDEIGLWGSIEVNPNDQDAVNCYERVKRGDVTQCSFGFDILAEDTEALEDGKTHYHIRKIKLYEVSVVTFPAYKDTGVQARSKDFAEMQRQNELKNWKETQLKKLKEGA